MFSGGQAAPLPQMQQDPTQGMMQQMVQAPGPQQNGPLVQAGGAGQGAPTSPPFPSTDPGVLSHILAMLGTLRQGDQQQLQSEQDSVLMSLLQAMGIGAQSPSAGFAEGSVPPGAPS